MTHSEPISDQQVESSHRLQQILLERYQTQGELPFHEFMQIALFEPELGYYARKDRPRVGKSLHHDFTTATQLGELWGKLLKETLLKLLAPEDPAEYTLVEIGVEPEGSPLSRMAPAPFKAIETRSLGESLQLPAKSVVFFNEVLDAQPFHRVRFTPDGWKEAALVPDNSGADCLWNWTWLTPSADLISILNSISKPLPGQIIDLPLAACDWLRDLLNLDWEGILLTADYGKTWHELVHEFPEGTGRAFYKQKVHNDLLSRPGNQDLTCDPCWDWLEAVLREKGCTAVQRQRLEAFWVEHARETLEHTFMHGDMRARSLLKEILHPSFYGMRFEALSARVLKNQRTGI